MRMMTFAKRCSKEILRDPINLGFGLGFPLVLLVLLSAMQANIPVSLFEIDTLTPGITVFGLSFMTLFSATLIAKDRESALLQRLYTTPLTGFDFIMGYMLPLLPIAIGQVLICYLFAIPLGLTVSANIVYAVIGIIPMAVFNISLGLLCGSVFGVKQVGGICGALPSQRYDKTGGISLPFVLKKMLWGVCLGFAIWDCRIYSTSNALREEAFCGLEAHQS